MFIYIDALTGELLLPKSITKPTTIIDDDIRWSFYNVPNDIAPSIAIKDAYVDNQGKFVFTLQKIIN